jgi:hypothetical protein
MASVVDLRGACPMPALECPDRCACPFNLWAWVRPRLAAVVVIDPPEDGPPP